MKYIVEVQLTKESFAALNRYALTEGITMDEGASLLLKQAMVLFVAGELSGVNRAKKAHDQDMHDLVDSVCARVDKASR